VHEKVRNLFTSWVSAVLFMTIEMTKDSDDKFAFSSGNRIIYTQKVAGIHDVKNRYNLDPILSAPEENPFKSFYDGFKMYFKTTKGNDEAKRIEMLITELLPNVKDDVMVGKIKSSMEKNRGSVENLIKVKTKVEQLIGV
jgi:hypothetical protein